MGWFKKLIHRQETHEEWLAKHPGKESSKSLPPVSSDDEQRATRGRMEGEMDTQRAGRKEQ